MDNVLDGALDPPVPAHAAFSWRGRCGDAEKCSGASLALLPQRRSLSCLGVACLCVTRQHAILGCAIRRVVLVRRRAVLKHEMRPLGRDGSAWKVNPHRPNICPIFPIPKVNRVCCDFRGSGKLPLQCRQEQSRRQLAPHPRRHLQPTPHPPRRLQNRRPLAASHKSPSHPRTSNSSLSR